jgi:tetratricopeptide (TPR) repeat protein
VQRPKFTGSEVTGLALLVSLLLSACSASPKPPPEPTLRKQAVNAETDGARRYAQGDYAGAIRLFAEAQRLQQSVDDARAAARNRLHQAQAELALGQAALALSHASEVRESTLWVSSLLLQVQAQLALQQWPMAQATLNQLIPLCATGCADLGRLRLLQARTALAQGHAQEALAHAQTALPLLREQQEERELANAWRLSAQVSLGLGDTVAALASVESALGIDRQLALPEKIARDWLLIGDIRRQSQSSHATSAYQRALAVAQAAGLVDVVKIATEALKEPAQ